MHLFNQQPLYGSAVWYSSRYFESYKNVNVWFLSLMTLPVKWNETCFSFGYLPFKWILKSFVLTPKLLFSVSGFYLTASIKLHLFIKIIYGTAKWVGGNTHWKEYNYDIDHIPSFTLRKGYWVFETLDIVFINIYSSSPARKSHIST